MLIYYLLYHSSSTCSNNGGCKNVLDDRNVLKQRDPKGALDIAGSQYQQCLFESDILDGEHDNRLLKNIVVTGMGGSALAANIAKTWLSDDLNIPLEIVRDYTLPAYVDHSTLVIASSYSGNTEETVACLDEALKRDAQTAVMSAGGKVYDTAKIHHLAHIDIPAGIQPRMATIYMLCALTKLLVHFGVTSSKKYNEIAAASKWLEDESSHWASDVSTDKNYAKQLALIAVGKTPVFYASSLFMPVAYKWKISWNENAKNVAYNGTYPEFNHNEFMGWVSHPIEKPFVIFDLISEDFDSDKMRQRFALSDKLLSGKRPKSNIIHLKGSGLLRQMLWACVLADFVSIYVAILNGVDPTPVDLIEKFKKELA